MPTVMPTARTVATTACATVWAPTRQRAQPTNATNGDSTSRIGPKSSTKTVTLSAMPRMRRLTFEGAPCATAMAITAPATTEVTVARSARGAWQAGRFAERRFYAAVHILQLLSFTWSNKRQALCEILTEADAR